MIEIIMAVHSWATAGGGYTRTQNERVGVFFVLFFFFAVKRCLEKKYGFLLRFIASHMRLISFFFVNVCRTLLWIFGAQAPRAFFFWRAFSTHNKKKNNSRGSAVRAQAQLPRVCLYKNIDTTGDGERFTVLPFLGF